VLDALPLIHKSADQAFVACDLILYLLLLKEKEDDSGPGCP